MKYKFTLLTLLFFAILAGIISCQKDDSHLSKSFSTGTSRMITLEELKGIPKAYQKFNAVIQKQQRKSAADSIWEFEVLTDDILMYEKNGYKSFTFVVAPKIERTYVENLVLNQEADGSYSVYYTVYNFTEEEKEKIAKNEHVYYKEKFFICPLPEYDATQLLKARKLGQVYQIGNDCYQDYVETITGWSNIPGQTEYSENVVYTEKVDCPQLDDDPSYSQNGGGSGGGPPSLYFPSFGPDGYVPNNPGVMPGNRRNAVTKPMITVADLGCGKIKTVMELGGYRAKIVAMADKVNDPVNEHGMAQYLDGSTAELTPGPEIEISSFFFLNALHHTHNAAADNGTYSVFSYSDIDAIMQLLVAQKINPDNFIATLSTKKGTHYAFTIGNVTKFKAFFYHKFNTMTATTKDKWQKAKDNEDALRKKYFDPDTGKIKKQNVNNELALGHFLNFMKEADLGVSLFETDATFQSFTKVDKAKSDTDDITIKRTDCNPKKM